MMLHTFCLLTKLCCLEEVTLEFFMTPKDQTPPPPLRLSFSNLPLSLSLPLPLSSMSISLPISRFEVINSPF